jgi:hypothetical protein
LPRAGRTAGPYRGDHDRLRCIVPCRPGRAGGCQATLGWYTALAGTRSSVMTSRHSGDWNVTRRGALAGGSARHCDPLSASTLDPTKLGNSRTRSNKAWMDRGTAVDRSGSGGKPLDGYQTVTCQAFSTGSAMLQASSESEIHREHRTLYPQMRHRRATPLLERQIAIGERHIGPGSLVTYTGRDLPCQI